MKKINELWELVFPSPRNPENIEIVYNSVGTAWETVDVIISKIKKNTSRDVFGVILHGLPRNVCELILKKLKSNEKIEYKYEQTFEKDLYRRPRSDSGEKIEPPVYSDAVLA